MVRYDEVFRASGGNQVRLLTTLMKFRARFGCFPTELQISPNTLMTLVCHHFTPYGFYLLQQKIRIVEPDSEEEFLLLAKDERGRTFDYVKGIYEPDTNEDIEDIDYEDVDEWLGFGKQ